jgi:thiamine-phosphate pyrophosphorylase
MNRSSPRDRIAGARLYVLLDGRSCVADLEWLAGELVSAHAHALQLRDKGLTDRELLERARVLRRLTRSSGTLFFVNDRPDLAALSDADGVHVGQDDLLIEDVRRLVGPDRLIGVSTHSIEQARQAAEQGAQLIGVGPVFPSMTKGFSRFVGVDLLRQVAAEIRLPVFAIGGIDAERLPQVLATGIRRVAIGSAITASCNPRSQAETLLSMLQAGD